MTASEAYGRFTRELLEHFRARANQDAALGRLQLPPEPSGPCDNILAFKVLTVPGERDIRLDIRLAFRQSRIVRQAAGQRKTSWKVFALEIGLGNDPNRQTMPIGWHGISGKIFFIELPWGQGNSQSEYDRLSNHQVRERLFDFADDAIRFALSTINERNEGRAGSRR